MARKQKHTFNVEGRTPARGNFPVDRSMIEIAAVAGGLGATRVPELVEKMERLWQWHIAERDDAVASDLHLAMSVLANALFQAEQRTALMRHHDKRLLRETYAEYCPKLQHERPNDSMAKPEYFGGHLGKEEDPPIALRHAAMSADIEALWRLSHMATIAAGDSKPKGGRPRLLNGVADEVLAMWRTLDPDCLFGRRDDPRPAFYACRVLLQVLFPVEAVDTIERATWEAFNRRPKAKKSGQETPAE
jgi:hypothetical protein